MDARSPIEGRAGHTLVRLSDVPQAVRLRVANRVIKYEGLVGVPALDLILAATYPRQDPELLVADEKARKVCGR